MDTSILCTHGALTGCLAVGVFAGVIWAMVDPRFDSLVFSKVPLILGAVIGAASGLILDHFIGPWC